MTPRTLFHRLRRGLALVLLVPTLALATERSAQPRIAPSWNSVVKSFPPGVKPFGLDTPQITALLRVAERERWQPPAHPTPEKIRELAEPYAKDLAQRIKGATPENAAALGAEWSDFKNISPLAPQNSAEVDEASNTLPPHVRQIFQDAVADWSKKQDSLPPVIVETLASPAAIPSEWKLAKATPRLTKGEERAQLESRLQETTLHVENLKLLRKGLVHDVNNNIMYIGNFAEILAKEAGPATPGAPLYSEISNNTDLLKRKLTDFLNWKEEKKSEESLVLPRDELDRLRSSNEEAAKEVESLISSLNDLAKDIAAVGKTTVADLQLLLSQEHNRGGENATATKKQLAKILRHVNIQQQIVGDYQNLSRLEAGKLKLNAQLLDIPPLVKEALKSPQPLADRKKITILFNFPQNAPRVKSDPAALSTILRNLIGNAVKYTPENGRVTIGVLQNSKKPGYATVFVEDNGIGISAEDKEKITAGFRTEEGKALASGHGIGLELVKRMVEASGSVLEINSEPGKGSRFYFDLPLARPPPKKQSPFQSDIEAAILLRQNKEHMTTPLPGVRALQKGRVDETAGSFSINEYPLVKYLKDRGHELIKLPEGGEKIRFSDALVDREITEFKAFRELRPGQPVADSDAVLNRIKESLHNGGQAPHIIMDVRFSGLSRDEAIRSFRRLRGKADKRLEEGKSPRHLKTLRIIGKGFDLKTDFTKPYQD